MNYILSYDISNNKTRNFISGLLIDSGFIRVQRSVFIGEISNIKINNILKLINTRLELDKDSLLCMPINKEEYSKGYKCGKFSYYNIYEKNIVYM